MINKAPVERADYETAAFAAALAAGSVFAGAAWVGSKVAGGSLPGLLKLVYSAGFNQMPFAAQLVFSISSGLSVAAGAAAFYFASKTKFKAEAHASGGRLTGTGGATKHAKKDPSPVLFKAAGLPFSLDRVRRSFMVLGSIGGGKTQAIWHLINGLIKNDFKLLVVDGPKGDFTRCWPTPPLVIAPWHQGYAWDIARDCPTRNHALTLSAMLIPVSEKDPLWGNAAGGVLVACLCKLQAEKKFDWGWGELYDEINQPIEQLKEIAQQYYPPAVQSVYDAESKTTQSIMINMSAFTGAIFEMSLAWRHTKNRFSFLRWWSDDATKTKVVVLQGSAEFEKISEAYIGGIISLLAAKTASTSFEESSTRKNCIILDEFAQLPKIKKFEKFIEIGRSKGCSVIIGTQSLSQIRKIYGQDDMQAWSAMVGTKIFARVTGFDDIKMVTDEIGEKEVFRQTQTLTSAAGGQSNSVAWQKEKIGIVTQSDLENLGPDKAAGGCKVIVKGFGSDPIETIFSFITNPVKRRVCIPNPDFNSALQPENIAPPVITATGTGADGEAITAATEYTTTDENISHKTDEYIDEKFSPENPVLVDVASENIISENSVITETEIADKGAETAFCMGLESIGIDSHVVELLANIDEFSNTNTLENPIDTPVVVDVQQEMITPKKLRLKKCNQPQTQQPQSSQTE